MSDCDSHQPPKQALSLCVQIFSFIVSQVYFQRYFQATTGKRQVKLKFFTNIFSFLVLKLFSTRTLKFMSAIFYQIIFSPNDSPPKTIENVLYHRKRFFHSRDINIFVIFSLPFHTLQIQKDKWKWNNLCHELACINLLM